MIDVAIVIKVNMKSNSGYKNIVSYLILEQKRI